MFNNSMMMQQQLPPVNPAAFGGLPQMGPTNNQPMQTNQSMNPQMAQYLMNKVAEIRSRMNGDPNQLGALGSMMQQPMMQQPQQPMMQQPMMRSY